MSMQWKSTKGIDEHHIVESFVNDSGKELAAIEYFCEGAYYPRALNAITGHWERGGPMLDLRDALNWAERVATGKMIEGDERPRFYY